MNDPAGAEALLDAAVSHWKARSAGDPAAASGLGWCLSCAIGLKLRLGKLEEAKQVRRRSRSGCRGKAEGA